MRDLNAKVGSDNTGYERTMGVHWHGTQNDNDGERLCEFCQLNGMVITGKLFPYKNIHKATWVSADGRVKNQIDQLLISGQWRSSILGTRVVDTNSIHYLVRTSIKVRLQSQRNKKKIKLNINVDRLKDGETKRKFCESVRSKLEENRTETEDIEEIWEQQRSAYTNAAEEVLGFRKGKSKPWISDNTWKLIDERKDIKIRTDREGQEQNEGGIQGERQRGEEKLEGRQEEMDDGESTEILGSNRERATEKTLQHSETADRTQHQASSCGEEK
ncbi:craniofacial development protein 2-like [Ylistrum balloti]|uniref:craniofacial development protein 2-like n=1 Tax=Ylistrum balloti TaxID=509963 RepID=UPI002905EC53|nr:craniofacial development protein 2-like [Ylistrum balloti]